MPSLKALLWTLCLSWLPFMATAADAPGEPPVQVRLALNWVPEPEFGGFYAAAIDGLYRREGLEVELLPGGAGAPTVQMLEAGRVEFAVTSGSEIAVARSRGARVVAVYSVFETSPMGIMAHASRGLDSLGALLGEPGLLAVEQGQPYVGFLRARYPAMQVRMVPYTGGVTRFLRDPSFAQQGFAFAEPVTARLAGVEPVFFLLADEGYNPYTVVLAVREDTLQNEPGRVGALVRAVREGWVRYRSAPEAANTYMRGLNPAMSAEAFELGALGQEALLGDGRMSTERWREHIEQLRAADSIQQAVDPAACFRNLP